MKKLIVILDDERLRTDLMSQQIELHLPQFDTVFFDNAPDMIDWLNHSLQKVNIMALDHDLGPNRRRDGEIFDPGIGRDVVDYLEKQKPVCPVLIHTTNQFGGDGMYYTLKDAGWMVDRVVPYNDLSWIGDLWIKKLVGLIDS